MNAKEGKVGPAMLEPFFIGPDQQADPETLLFAPASETFVKPLDTILCSVLGALTRQPDASIFPDAAAMWNLTSNINGTFRKKNAVPKMGRAFKF